jgi:hypothetical protein
MFVRHALF